MRRRHSVQVTKSKTTIELYLQLITVQAHISGLRSATDKQEARAGAAWAWEARPAHLLYRLPSACASWHQPASHGLERPLRLAADAAMFFRQALLPLPAAAKAAKRITWMQSPLQLSSQPARPQPASSSDVEPRALARLTRPARWQELAARRRSQRERHLEAAAAATVRDGQRHEKIAEKLRVPP